MPKNRTYHQDFLDTPIANQWQGGPLRDLFGLLAAQVRPLAPVHRVLPSGACVAMAQDNLGLRSVRILRRAHAKSCALNAGAAVCSCIAGGFHNEVVTFAKHFGIENWEWKDDKHARGVAVILLEQVPR